MSPVSQREQAEVASTAAALRDLLELDVTEARRIAGAVALVRRALGGGSARPPAGSVSRSVGSIASCLAGSAYESQTSPLLLSLPLTGAVVSALGALARSTRRSLVIESTPLTERFLKPVVGKSTESAAPIDFLRPGEMLRRLKSRDGVTPRKETYVTFPDHHMAPEDCCRVVRFFGRDHVFPLLEFLLHHRGARPLLTLSAQDDAGARVWCLRTYAGAVSAPGMAGCLDLLRWLAVEVESVMRRAPDDVLSWLSVGERALAAVRRRGLPDVRIVEGFLRSWRLCETDRNRALIDLSLERIGRLRTPGGIGSGRRLEPWGPNGH